jgi:IS5 family transposase
MDPVTDAQKQARMFFEYLPRKLNPQNKLYKLRPLINWEGLEREIAPFVPTSKLGRDKKSTRVMIALLMLGAMINGSDCFTSEELEENLYWQYFCGYDYMDDCGGVSESAVRRFRQALGEEGLNLILMELTRVGVKTGTIKKKDLDSVIIDTTVQIKNIKHPHDAHLLGKAREEIVKLMKEMGLKLNETYELAYKKLLIKLWKYKENSKAKMRFKVMRRMKTLVGRLIRVFTRNVPASNLKEAQKSIYDRVVRIYAQSFLSKTAKEEYKAAGNKVLYSFHASEVECIGKGKLHKPYEFGNKVGLGVTGRRNFILAIKSFTNNPYDGHTLDQTIKAIESNTKQSVDKAFVDLGYRGHNYAKKGKVYTPYTKKEITPEIKLMQKRRSAIEPIIGHLKQYGRMGRNYLKGTFGDTINPIISGIGFNLRQIANRVTSRKYCT